MEKKVMIFGKDGWPYTTKARSAYGDRATYVNVEKDSAGMKEMLRHSKGSREVPVIIEDQKVTIGYGGSWEV